MRTTLEQCYMLLVHASEINYNNGEIIHATLKLESTRSLHITLR